MAFREEQHARKGGKGSGDQAANRDKPPGKDRHSDRVPTAIRKDEEARLDKLMGPNPSPQKEEKVLKGEADKLSSRAKALIASLRVARKNEEEQAHQRGEKRKEEAKKKRTHENAERAKKGLPPLKEPKKRKDDSGGGSKKGGSSAGGKSSPSSSGPDRSTKEKLQVVYHRLVVVRDEAFSRGVKL